MERLAEWRQKDDIEEGNIKGLLSVLTMLSLCLNEWRNLLRMRNSAAWVGKDVLTDGTFNVLFAEWTARDWG